MYRYVSWSKEFKSKLAYKYKSFSIKHKILRFFNLKLPKDAWRNNLGMHKHHRLPVESQVYIHNIQGFSICSNRIRQSRKLSRDCETKKKIRQDDWNSKSNYILMFLQWIACSPIALYRMSVSKLLIKSLKLDNNE